MSELDSDFGLQNRIRMWVLDLDSGLGSGMLEDSDRYYSVCVDPELKYGYQRCNDALSLSCQASIFFRFCVCLHLH